MTEAERKLLIADILADLADLVSNGAALTGSSLAYRFRVKAKECIEQARLLQESEPNPHKEV